MLDPSVFLTVKAFVWWVVPKLMLWMPIAYFLLGVHYKGDHDEDPGWMGPVGWACKGGMHALIIAFILALILAILKNI
jgi:hypothetical protein